MNEHETTKDLTENLTDRQLLLLLLERVARLEAAEEERARERRPLWHRLDGQVAALTAQGETLTAQVGTLTAEMQEVKREIKLTRREIGLAREDIRNERWERAELSERVADLEQRLQSA